MERDECAFAFSGAPTGSVLWRRGLGRIGAESGRDPNNRSNRPRDRIAASSQEDPTRGKEGRFQRGFTLLESKTGRTVQAAGQCTLLPNFRG